MTDHWRYFEEFCRYEKAVGGPDPHMAVVEELGRDEPWQERVWLAGCYVAFYNAPAAEAVWRRWPWWWAREETPDVAWLRDNWQGLPMRRERRAVRTPEKMARHLAEYAQWAAGLGEAEWRGLGSEAYEAAWRDCQRVYGLGRYVALKLLELLHRSCYLRAELTDLRPKGGWSPRQALALLYPEHEQALNGDDRREHLDLTNRLGAETRGRLDHLDLTWYETQVLLCDYKQSWSGRRQFPGRSLDSEIEYALKVGNHFDEDATGIWDIRRKLFPAEALGEVNGWTRVRAELGTCLRDHGYTWSDLRYDFQQTEDLARPFERDPVPA